jgi:hypothetical protein
MVVEATMVVIVVVVMEVAVMEVVQVPQAFPVQNAPTARMGDGCMRKAYQ